MTFIEVEKNVRIFAQDWGAGKPVVFIHGFPFSHRIFERQMAHLALHNHRAIGIDLRGFGQSDKPWAIDYDVWAHDIKSVLTELNVEDAALVGFSMGGAIAAHFVAAHNSENRISKLILLGAATPIAAPEPENKAQLDQFIQYAISDQAAFSKAFVQNAFHRELSAENLAFYSQMGTDATIRAMVRGLEELRLHDLVQELTSINLPTLICHGTQDKVVPFAAGEAQHQLIKNSKLVRFEESGHGLFYDEAEKLNRELHSFVG